MRHDVKQDMNMKSLALRAVIVTGLSGCMAPSGWAQKQNALQQQQQPQQQQPQQEQQPEPRDVQVRGQVALADPAQAAPSNTRWAQTTIEVTRETALPNMDELSTFVDNTAGQLAPQMVGLPREQLAQFFTMKTERSAQTTRLTLTVDIPASVANARPAAREYLDRIVRDVLKYLDNTRTTGIDNRMKTARDSVAEAQQRMQAQTREIRALEKQLRDQSGRVDVSPQNLMNAIQQLDEEHMRLQIEQAAKVARRTALTKALADSKKEVEQRVGDDPVVKEMEKVVGIRTEALARKRQLAEQGVISKEDIAEAEAQLAQARAQLLDRRQQAAQQAGADMINSWNRELMGLSVDENEMLARLEQVTQRLDKMRTMLDSLNQLEDLQRQTEDAQRRVQEANARLQEMSERLRELADRNDTSIVRSNSAKEAPKRRGEDREGE